MENNINNHEANAQRTPCEVYSRVTGYLRPVKNWNDAKKSEWLNRKTFNAENYIKDNE